MKDRLEEAKNEIYNSQLLGSKVVIERHHAVWLISEVERKEEWIKCLEKKWDGAEKEIDSITKELEELKADRDNHLETYCCYDATMVPTNEEASELNHCKNVLEDLTEERDRWKNQAESLQKCSTFKKEYDPKWQNECKRLEAENVELKQEQDIVIEQFDALTKDQEDLTNELEEMKNES